MEHEIIEEVLFDDSNEVVDDSELVDSVEEIESDSMYSQDELVSALLSLMNEKAAEESDELEDEAQVFGLPSTSYDTPSPILVQSVDDSVDYTDLLISLDQRLDHIESVVSAEPVVQGLDTPLNEYSLNSILLVSIFVIFSVSFLYSFIKDNLIHF